MFVAVKLEGQMQCELATYRPHLTSLRNYFILISNRYKLG